MNITLTILELIAIILTTSGVTAGVILIMNNFLHHGEAPKELTDKVRTDTNLFLSDVVSCASCKFDKHPWIECKDCENFSKYSF